MKNDKDSDVRFSQDNVLHYQKTKNVFPVEKSDWDRLRGMIEKYSKISIVWWAVFSFFLSTALQFLLNYLLVEDQNPYKTFFLIGIVIGITGTIFSFISAITSKSVEGVKKDDILREMDRMEVPLDNEIINDEEKVENINVSVSTKGLHIIRGLYGVTDKYIDVTDKLNEQVVEGRLQTDASNTLVNSDPAPGIRKHLEVEYEYAGIKIIKRFAENESVSLP